MSSEGIMSIEHPSFVVGNMYYSEWGDFDAENSDQIDEQREMYWLCTLQQVYWDESGQRFVFVVKYLDSDTEYEKDLAQMRDLDDVDDLIERGLVDAVKTDGIEIVGGEDSLFDDCLDSPDNLSDDGSELTENIVENLYKQMNTEDEKEGDKDSPLAEQELAELLPPEHCTEKVLMQQQLKQLAQQHAEFRELLSFAKTELKEFRNDNHDGQNDEQIRDATKTINMLCTKLRIIEPHIDVLCYTLSIDMQERPLTRSTIRYLRENQLCEKALRQRLRRETRTQSREVILAKKSERTLQRVEARQQREARRSWSIREKREDRKRMHKEKEEKIACCNQEVVPWMDSAFSFPRGCIKHAIELVPYTLVEAMEPIADRLKKKDSEVDKYQKQKFKGISLVSGDAYGTTDYRVFASCAGKGNMSTQMATVSSHAVAVLLRCAIECDDRLATPNNAKRWLHWIMERDCVQRAQLWIDQMISKGRFLNDQLPAFASSKNSRGRKATNSIGLQWIKQTAEVQLDPELEIISPQLAQGLKQADFCLTSKKKLTNLYVGLITEQHYVVVNGDVYMPSQNLVQRPRKRQRRSDCSVSSNATYVAHSVALCEAPLDQDPQVGDQVELPEVEPEVPSLEYSQEKHLHVVATMM